jgi:LSD1 subclass zinc finger protein
MMKVLLLIDCDSCRRLFAFSRTASTDRTAWSVHSGALEKMACADGWGVSEDGNSHYCPACLHESETMMFQFPLRQD